VQEAGLADQITIDSCGTYGYHVGEPADRRSQAAARARGYEFGDLKARKLAANDFRTFDLILAMDRGHMEEMQAICPPEERGRLKMFLDYAPAYGPDVPDPYYGGSGGFEHVLDMIEEASRVLLENLQP